MSKPGDSTEAVRYVRAQRISTDEPEASLVDEEVGLALEAPVVIEIDGLGSYTNLCLPVERRAMALGFLFSEGLIDGPDDVASLERLVFRTGEYRLSTMRPYEAEPQMNDGLPGCDAEVARAVFHVDNVVIESAN